MCVRVRVCICVLFHKEGPLYKLQTPQNLDPPRLTLLWISEFTLARKSSGLRTHCAHADPPTGPLRGQDRPHPYLTLSLGGCLSNLSETRFFAIKWGYFIWQLTYSAPYMGARDKILSKNGHKGMVLVVVRHRDWRGSRPLLTPIHLTPASEIFS